MRSQQIVMEDEVTRFVARHSKSTNDSIYKSNLDYERRLLDMNRNRYDLSHKLNTLEKETSEKVKHCVELENLLKGYKQKLNETQYKIDEEKAMSEQEKDRLRRRYEKKIEELEEKLKNENHYVSSTGTELIQKLEALKRSLDKDDTMRRSGSTNELVFMTANASFHEAPDDAEESESNTSIGTLIDKIDKLLNKNNDFSVAAYEKQIAKLDKELTAVREQCVVDRQSARTANLALWKLEKQVAELEGEKKSVSRRYDYANDKVKTMKEEVDSIQLKLSNTKEMLGVKDNEIQGLHHTIRELKHDRQVERNLRINYEKECMRQKSEMLEHQAKVKSLEEMLKSNTKMLNEVQQKNDDLISQQQKLRYELEQKLNTCTLANTITADKSRELQKMQRHYEMLKKACSITDKQITELENKLKSEDASKRIDQKKIRDLQNELSKRNNELHMLKRDFAEEKEARLKSDEKIEKLKGELNKVKDIRETQKTQAFGLQKEVKQMSEMSREHEHRIHTLTDQVQGLKSINQSNDRQIHFLKEDNSKILSDLFLAREEIQALKQQIDDYDLEINNLMQEINIREGILLQQKTCQTQSDIKSRTTIAQCKKLIEHLQCQVAKNKKNKTLAEKLLGLESKPHAK